MERSVVKRSDAGGGWGHSAELQFGSLPIAGHLWRGTPVGSWVVRGQGIQGPLTIGLPEGFQLPGQHVTPANPQEGRQAPAQALGGLHPGAVVEKLAHGVSGEVVLGGEGPVKGCQHPPPAPSRPAAPWKGLQRGGRWPSYRKHGRESRHVPLGLGGGGTVSLQEGQVAAAEAALLHDAAAAAAAAACSAGRSACNRGAGQQRGPSGQGAPKERGSGGALRDDALASGRLPPGTESGHSLWVPGPRAAWKMGSGGCPARGPDPTFGDQGSRPGGRAGTRVPP